MPPGDPPSRPISIPDQVEYRADDPGTAPAAPIWAEVEERLSRERLFWLVGTRPDGRPHAVALWAIWEDGSYWFTMSPRTRMAAHLAANPSALVHLPDAEDAVVVEGIVARPSPVEVPATVVDRYEATYGYRLEPSDPAMPYHRLRATLVRAWRSADIRGTATRWDLTGVSAEEA